jgi:protein-S-isoprenylcysteine O-methyltransferase Ste14
MNLAEIPESKPSNRVTVPRWMAIILALLTCLIAIPLAHGVLPWAISTRMPRYGWAEGTPGMWNRLGLILVALAAALLIWILVSGIAQTPKSLKLGLTPSFLMISGPYKYTRNPMYVAELGLWLGWAIFFGSAGVFIGCLVLWSVVELVILPREERGLEAAFGPTYLQYKNSVPRWVGKTKK